MPRIKLFWKLLLAFFVACTLAGVGAWFAMLTRICSNPRAPDPATGHVVAYSCHGMTVFISGFEQWLFAWLLPVESLFIFLTVVTAVLALLSSAKVRIDVQVHVTDTSGQGGNRGERT